MDKKQKVKKSAIFIGVPSSTKVATDLKKQRADKEVKKTAIFTGTPSNIKIITISREKEN